MKFAKLLAAALIAAMPAHALAQSSPNLTYKQVPTAAQWNSYFAAKQDVLGYVPLNVAGGVMTGRLVTAAPGATVSGLNLTPGSAPGSPANGDLWVTPTGVYAQVNGSTVGPFVGPSGGSFAATSPLAVTFPGGVVTYALNKNSTLTVSGSNLGVNLANANSWSALQMFGAGATITSAFTATGLVKNSDLVSASTTVNGQTCTLGSSCTITASAGTITVGVTTVASATNTNILYNNSGTLGQYSITGTGNVVMSASPTLTGTITGASLTLSGTLTIGATTEVFPISGLLVGTTDAQTLTNKSMSGSSNTFTSIPNSALVNASVTVGGATCTLGSTCTPIQIGITSGATLALNGCTIGSNALCLTGTETITTSSASAFAVGPNGATNPALVVDASAPSLAAGLKVAGAPTGGTVTISAIDSGANTSIQINPKGSGAITLNGSTGILGAISATSTSATALTVGPNGTTNPVFSVNAAGASAATGLQVAGFAAGSGVGVIVTSAGANEALVVNAKGTGGVSIGSTSTGGVALGAGGGGVTATALTVNTSFTATGLVGYGALASAAIANASNYFSGASNVVVPASVIYQAETTTTYGTTTTLDFNTFINTAVTLTGNITTMTLNNVKAGQAGTITFIQDATGSRTTVWNSIFKFAGGATPSLSTAGNAVDVLSYSCRSATFCIASLGKQVQ